MNKWKKLKVRFWALSKIAMIIIILIWLAVAALTAHAFTTKQFIEQKINKNVIIQSTVFDYKTKALPYGVVGVEGVIFPKTQNVVDVYVKTAITADKPVTVKGNYSILLKLVAEGLWERTTTLKGRQNFNMKGESVEVINQKVSIDLGKIYSDIETISNKAIGHMPAKFLLHVIPVIEGDITFENRKINLESNTAMMFELSESQMMLSGENEYFWRTPVDEIKVVEYKLNLFNLMVPVPVYRYVSLSVFLIYSAFVLLVLISRKQIEIEHMTEDDKIEKRYRNRLVSVRQPIEFKDKTLIPLDSMKELVRISDEQDRGILKYRDDMEEKTYYCVIEDDYIYIYTVNEDNGKKKGLYNYMYDF